MYKGNSANFAVTEFSEIRIAPVQRPKPSLPPGRFGMSGGASGAGEGIRPTVAALGNADLAPGSSHALSAFAVALLA
jgi:hypothetical protein